MLDLPSAGRILTVCTANVCRSPLAALGLQEALRGPLADAVVVSAGVRAMVGAPMCSTARAQLREPAEGEAHAARELTVELIEEADLVLAMEKQQRGAVARLLPGHQRKAFTLREATAMAEAIGHESSLPTTVAELSARMHALRGIVRPAVEEPAARPWFLRFLPPEETTDDGLSIADGHVVDDAAHDRTVRAVRDLVDRFAESLAPQRP